MSTPVGTESESTSAGNPLGLTVSVSRSIEAPLAHVWEVLVGSEGSSALLGEGAVLGSKGEAYHCTDGTWGVVRSYHPLEQLRVSWHADAEAKPSLVEVDLRAEGAGTVLDLRHDRLTDDAVARSAQERWTAGLDSLASRVTG
jgi:uncharacterized protein YndB with AHSA1/START domain